MHSNFIILKNLIKQSTKIYVMKINTVRQQVLIATQPRLWIPLTVMHIAFLCQ